MGRLWRGMGGMVRPEPLSEHHPHQQQGFGVSRITRHESRPFIAYFDPKTSLRVLAVLKVLFKYACARQAARALS